MNINPLVKIPCLLLVTGYHHLAYTSPNPTAPPSKKNHPAESSLADRIVRSTVMVQTRDYVKGYLWCAALAESAVIFANVFPSLPISKTILEGLLFGGDGSRIRLTTSAVVGVALGIAGGTWRAWCYREMGKHFTFEMSIMKDHNLVTTGPYSIVRHPGYTGAIMIAASIFLVHATEGSWVRESGVLHHILGKIGTAIAATRVVVITSALLGRMKAEDRELRERFGDKWDTWAAHVRYMVIPGIL